MTLIDTVGALERFDNDKEIYLELVETFLELPPADFASMKTRLESGQTGDVLHDIHQLKGAAMTLGADPLARSAAALEALLRTSSSDDPYPELTRVSELYLGTIKELEQVRNELRTHP